MGDRQPSGRHLGLRDLGLLVGATACVDALGSHQRCRPRRVAVRSGVGLRNFIADPTADFALCVLVGPHGLTDIDDARTTQRGWQVLTITYSVVFLVAWLLQHFLDWRTSRLLLRGFFGVASAYHLREDMGRSLARSAAVHVAAVVSAWWFGPMAPWRVMVAWLSLWHAPNHYARYVTAPDRNIRAGLGMVAAGVVAGFCVWKTNLFLVLPEWFVVAAVIGHVVCTESWRMAGR